MNFKLYMELFGNFNYQMSDSKQTQMFDFYMLSFLLGRSQYDKYRLKQSANKQPEMDEEDQQDYMLQEVADELLPKLKQDMLDAVFFSMCCEIRHAGTYATLSPYVYNSHYTKKLIKKIEQNKKDFHDIYQNFHYERKKDLPPEVEKLGYSKISDSKHIIGRLASFIVMNKMAKSEGIVETVHFMQDVFENLIWQPNYGGKAWAGIAEAWLMLNDAKTQSQIIVAIDHMYDIQHNTGSVFNKILSYTQNGTYYWLGLSLNFKANIKNPHEIADLVSPNLKKLAFRIIKSKMGMTYEDFMKDSKSNEIVYTVIAADHSIFKQFDNLAEAIHAVKYHIAFQKGVDLQDISWKKEFTVASLLSHPGANVEHYLMRKDIALVNNVPSGFWIEYRKKIKSYSPVPDINSVYNKIYKKVNQGIILPSGGIKSNKIKDIIKDKEKIASMEPIPLNNLNDLEKEKKY